MSTAAEVEDAYRYLVDGGVGETMGLAMMASQTGAPKVQMSTDHAIALCILADEALKLRSQRESRKDQTP